MKTLRDELHTTSLDWDFDRDRDTVDVRKRGVLVVIGAATTETGEAADGYDATAYDNDDPARPVCWSAHYPTAPAAVDALSAL